MRAKRIPHRSNVMRNALLFRSSLSLTLSQSKKRRRDSSSSESDSDDSEEKADKYRLSNFFTAGGDSD